MEGVERYKVRLMPHNPEREDEYNIVKTELLNLWKKNILDIQHVGSTSIKSICAKPILDIAVKLASIKNINVESLQKAGYSYCGVQHGNENYHLFVLRGENQISLRHIHCYDRSEREFEQLVGFCNYLNSHCDEALQYENIKKKLAKEYPNDRIAYTKGKEEFIKSIYDKLDI
ncbi:MAG: GrpB family protein [Acutalibacteraceae bacterium]|nr:GrpB family protein [Acutalibacteraceae bacterium]